jgi:hypothetical protein
MPCGERGAADADGDKARKWSLHVRILAVCHVLSYGVQALAFVGLALPAAFLTGFGRALDPMVIGLRVTSAAILGLCWVFRRWFVWWGRKNYPTGKPE